MVKEGEFKTIKTVVERKKSRLNKITDIYTEKKIKDGRDDVNLNAELYHDDHIKDKNADLTHIEICIHQQCDSFGFQELMEDD